MKNQFTLLLLFFVFSCNAVLASHITGGEMSYTCLGDDDYLIELKLYRDCFSGQAGFDNPTNVFIFDDDGDIVATLPIAFPGSDTLPSVSNCGASVFGVCTEEAVFTFEVNLPADPGGYTLVYQRCCLSAAFSNIIDPSNFGLSMIGTIPGSVLCNSSPKFNSFPSTWLCTGVPVNIDHSATDPDGDVLEYELCAARAGASSTNPYPNPPSPPPYGEIIYAASYSGTYPITSDPAFSINESTGEITGTPTDAGMYLLNVCVKEYRDGNLLSEHRRVMVIYSIPYYLGSADPVENKSFHIYPNPTSERIYVKSESLRNGEWRIYNSQGVLVNRSTLENVDHPVELNVQAYADGLYYFQWIHDSKVITQTFVIAR